MAEQSWRSGKTTAQRGYGGAWQRARIGFLRKHPLCVICQRSGRVTAASVVDHIRPHGGDLALFWDRENWQALCKSCHDRFKQGRERGGDDSMLGSCSTAGMPTDPEHPWNR